MSHQIDLFGAVQPDLFGDDAGGQAAPRIDIAVVRRRLEAILAELRAAERASPWPEETTRLNQLLFPQMAEWLPPEERDQLCLDFTGELRRLRLAA
jgi:hypothetical protein